MSTADPVRTQVLARRITPIAAALAVWMFVGLPLGVLPGWLPKPTTTDASYIDDWAKWNFSGYERKEAYPEYKRVIDMMGPVGRTNGCGRTHWEYDSTLDRFGTPMALMLLPYWTDGCIGSMEGLYFESSATVPYHFMTAAELSKAPSNPQRDLPYTSLDVAKGVQHLQMLGARYYLAFSPEAVAQADANPDLTLVAPDRRVAGLRGGGLGARRPPWQPAGGDHRRGQGRAGLDGRHGRLVPGLRRPRRVPGRVRAQGVAAGRGQQGRHRRRRRSAPTSRSRPPSGGRSTRWRSAASRTSDNRISFDVDRVGRAGAGQGLVLPQLEGDGGHGPYRVSPNLMVVIPTSTHVSVYYGWTPVDYTGWILTFIGIGLAVSGPGGGPMVVDDPEPADAAAPSPSRRRRRPARRPGPRS